MITDRGSIAVRTIKSLGVARGDAGNAEAFAAGQDWQNSRDVIASLKSAVESVGTDNLAPPTPASFDFAEFIRPQTIIGRLTGLRRVPSRVRLISAITGSAAFWSGERQPRPISSMAFAGETLAPLSVTAMLIVSQELLRSAAHSAESILSLDLGRAIVSALDAAFIDSTNAGIADVMPAGIGYGAAPFHSSGNTVALIDADLALLIAAISAAGSDLTFASWIMRPATALYLAGLRSASGDLAYPGMSAKGGVLIGLPAITSAAVSTTITLIDPAQVLVADDGGGALEVSRQASVEMETAPGSPATTLVSLWQNNLACLKLSRYVNWQRVRDGAVQILDQVAY